MKKISYKKSSIYFFTGTGNAEKISRWIASTFENSMIPSTIVNIASHGKQINKPSNDELIGFCSPTHGFNFPPVMLKFMFRFPRGNGQKVFIINTRAGMKLGKIFLPGLSGVAQLFSALIFIIKGYKIVGMRPIDMPSNWISIHPGIKEKVAHSIMLHCKTKTIKMASRLVKGKRDFRALFDIIQDVLLTPIALGYYVIGRFVLAKTFYADKTCTNCYQCIRDCPIKAIQKVNSRPYWTYRCESCMHCMNNCPTRSIQTAHGMVIGVFYLVITFFMKHVWNITLKSLDYSIIRSIYQNGLLKFTIDTVVCFLFLLIAYRIMHYLLKYRFVERIIFYTSLSGFKFWRRFKGIKIVID